MEKNQLHTLQKLYWKYTNERYLIVREGKKDEVKAWRYFIGEQKAPSIIFNIEGARFGFLLPRNFNINNN